MDSLADRLREHLNLPEASDEEILSLTKNTTARIGITMNLACENIKKMFPCAQEAAEALVRFSKAIHEHHSKEKQKANKLKLKELRDRF